MKMPAAHDALLERVTIDSGVRFGKPCIRGHRITVQEVLEWLSTWASQQQIMADYPQLEPMISLRFTLTRPSWRRGARSRGNEAHGQICTGNDKIKTANGRYK
jgi:uncharacterized protein (DUF433 family)